MSILETIRRKIGIGPPQPPLVDVPLVDEAADAFFARVTALLADGKTHVYFDTSMLMWLTKVGDAARSQLLGWLETNCRGRLHVPVWSAHEYFRHHVAKTVSTNLGDAAKGLRKAAGVYRTIHPYLDEPLGDESPRRQQSEARQVLKRTVELADALDKWAKFYQPHAAAVLEFINRHCTAGTNIFEMMGGIEVVGTARFAGRLPPGFRDKHKKEGAEGKRGSNAIGQNTQGQEDGEDGAGATIGHNRWGDLIFWSEILDHARTRRARAVLILTNDRKNDWFMGGNMAGATADMKQIEGLKCIPRPHPLLAAEARSTARIAELVLIDSPYAGLLLKRLAPAASDAFADAALVQKLAPTPVIRSEAQPDEQGATHPAPPVAVPAWRDAENLAYSKPKLRDALTVSRAAPTGKAADLIALAEAALAAGDGISSVLTEENLFDADVNALVTFAREVGDRARAGVANFASAASDIAGQLMVVPRRTAGCLFFGLLASAHFSRANNAVYLPPSAPFLGLLWDLAGVQHFDPAIASVRERIDRGDRRPLFVIGDPYTVAVVLEIDIEGDVPTDLRQVKMAGELLVMTPQFRGELRLRDRAGGEETLSGERIARIACEVFGVPFEAVTKTPDFKRDFSIKREIGFKNPGDVYIEKVEAE